MLHEHTPEWHLTLGLSDALVYGTLLCGVPAWWIMRIVGLLPKVLP